jgi:hypothetical protein
MLTVGSLDQAFKIYWDEQVKCRKGRAYYALLHLTVCLPDVCAALQSADGKTTGPRYRAWSDEYLTNPMLTGSERWEMRCKVLHEGRASIPAGRYDGFSFSQPAATGEVDHLRLDGKTLILDVGKLADEMKGAVETWIGRLEASSTAEASNTAKNLPSLIQVRHFPLPGVTGIRPIIINRSS